MSLCGAHSRCGSRLHVLAALAHVRAVFLAHVEEPWLPPGWRHCSRRRSYLRFWHVRFWLGALRITSTGLWKREMLQEGLVQVPHPHHKHGLLPHDQWTLRSRRCCLSATTSSETLTRPSPCVRRHEKPKPPAILVSVQSHGVGVLRSCLPASLVEHLSMDLPRIPPTQGTTVTVQSVLPCPRRPCQYRMCVIAERRSGLHNGHFLAPPHPGALCLTSSNCSPPKPGSKNRLQVSFRSSCCLDACFTPRRAPIFLVPSVKRGHSGRTMIEQE